MQLFPPLLIYVTHLGQTSGWKKSGKKKGQRWRSRDPGIQLLPLLHPLDLVCSAVKGYCTDGKFQKDIYLQQVWERWKHLWRPDLQPFLSAGRLLTVRHVTQVQDGRQDGEYPTRNATTNQTSQIRVCKDMSPYGLTGDSLSFGGRQEADHLHRLLQSLEVVSKVIRIFYRKVLLQAKSKRPLQFQANWMLFNCRAMVKDSEWAYMRAFTCLR